MDYRICCAMINFNFRPCVPDGENTTQIAKRIKNKCYKTKNQLLPLLNMSFTATIKSSDLKTIISFPKLTLYQLKKYITLGSFKIRQCQSYIQQIVHHGKAYLIQPKQIRRYVSNKN